MAKKEDLKIGDHVSFLRMSNKAIRLTGTIAAFHDDGVPCVDVELDGHEDAIDTAHVDDVTVLEEAETLPSTPATATAAVDAANAIAEAVTAAKSAAAAATIATQAAADAQISANAAAQSAADAKASADAAAKPLVASVVDPVAAETASPALEANLEKLGEAHEGNVVEIPKAE